MEYKEWEKQRTAALEAFREFLKTLPGNQEVGDLIGMDNIVEVTAAVLSAYGYSLPKADEEDNPNRESGQQSS